MYRSASDEQSKDDIFSTLLDMHTRSDDDEEIVVAVGEAAW